METKRDVAEESGQYEKPLEQPAQQRENTALLEEEQTLSPRPSLWPVALALTLVLTCIGVITHPILLGVGTALAAVAILGWMREKH